MGHNNIPTVFTFYFHIVYGPVCAAQFFFTFFAGVAFLAGAFLDDLLAGNELRGENCLPDHQSKVAHFSSFQRKRYSAFYCE